MSVPRRPPVRLSECRDCGLPAVWIELDTGSRMLLDPVPLDRNDPRGNVAARVLGTGPGRRLHGWVIARDKPLAEYMLLMRPHVATCTDRPRPDRPADATLF